MALKFKEMIGVRDLPKLSRLAKSAQRKQVSFQADDDALQKKRNINEQYSFMMGKLDRSASSRTGKKIPLKQQKMDNSFDYGLDSRNTLLPPVKGQRSSSRLVYNTLDNNSNTDLHKLIPKGNISHPSNSR